MLIAYNTEKFSSVSEFRHTWDHILAYILGSTLNAEEFYDDQSPKTSIQSLLAVKNKLQETATATLKIAEHEKDYYFQFIYLSEKSAKLAKQTQTLINELNKPHYSDKGIRQRFRNLLQNIHNKIDISAKNLLDFAD